MSETTGGSGGSGGGSTGGSQVEGLQINFSAPGAEQTAQSTDKVAAAVETFGRVTVRSRLSLEDLIASGAKFDTQQSSTLNYTKQAVIELQNQVKAQQDAKAAIEARIAAEREAERITLANFEAGTRFEAKLRETIDLFGKGEADVLRYKAAQLQVSDAASGLIDKYEKLIEAARQNEIQQKRDIELYSAQAKALADQTRMQQERDVWEHDQRTKAHNDYVAFWDKQLATQAESDAKLLAEEQRTANRQKQIQQERDTWSHSQRQKEAAEYEQWWSKELKDKESALKRELDLDIAYGEKSLKAQIDTLAKIKAYQADSRTSGSGVDLGSMFGPKAVGEVDTLNAKVKQYNETLGHHGQKLDETGKKLNGTSEAMSLWGRIMDNSRIRTEGLVLAHEALQGRFTRFGGSLGVMTEYLTAANIPIMGMVGGLVAVAAAVVGVVYEMSKGQAQWKELANDLERTNNYAGTTAGAMDALAHSVAGAHGNFEEAYKSISTLTASGKFTADQIAEITKATVDLNHVMGTDINTTIKEFETLAVRSTSNSSKGMLEVAVALEKLDQKYHFLNATQLEQVILLEKQGKTAEASQLAVHLLAEETQRAADAGEGNIGLIEKGWRGVLGVVHNITQAVADLGKKSLELKAEKIHDVLLEQLPSKNILSAKGGFETDESKLDKDQIRLLHAYYDIQKQIADKNKEADEQGKARQTQSDADHVIMQRAAQDRTLLKKTANELDDALQSNSEQLTKILAADPTYLNDPKNQEYEDDRVEAIMKAHTKKVSTIKSDGRKEDLQNQLNADQAAYNLLLEANKHDIDTLKQLADQKEITRQQEYDGVTAAYQDELQALQVMEAAKIATLEKYKPLNAKDAEETKKRLADVRRDYALTAIEIQNAKEKEQQAIVGKAVKEVETDDKKKIAAIDEQIKSQQKFNNEYRKTAEEKKKLNELLGEETLKTMKLDLAKSKAIAADPNQGKADREAARKHVEELEIEIGKQEQLNTLYKEGQKIAEGADAQKSVAKYLDPTNVRSFGDEFSGAFDKAGKSVASFITVLEKMSAQQKKNQQEQTNNAQAYIDDTIDAKTYEEQKGKITTRNTHDQLAGYAALSSTAASFFGEHSKGYKMLTTVSQAFHLAEIAMTTAELVPKAISAVLSQGQGDPYTAFGRMAAMAAIVAGLGVAIGGAFGGSGSEVSAKDRQAAQGAGSVLGATDSKSESITNALGMIEKNTYQDLTISTSMLSTLRSINAGISGLGNVVTRSIYGGNTATNSLESNKALTGVGPAMLGTGTLFGSVFGSFASWALSKVSRTKTTVQDQGLDIDSSSLSKILQNGVTGSAYTDINTKKTAFGISYSNKNSELTDKLPADTLKQLTMVISGIQNGVSSAVTALGAGGDAFTAKLNSFVVDIGKISLKGLSGDEIQKALESVFSKLGDDMATFAVDGLTDLQKVGEGAFETLTRIATEYQTVDVVLQSFGKSFGTVGIKSMAARDHLIELSGGLEQFTSQAEYLLKNFYTEDEQAAALKKQIKPTLDQYGLTTDGDEANKMFAKFVTSLDLTTDAGAQAYATLMTIAPAFKQITDQSKKVSDERKGLQGELDSLTLTSVQLLKKQRDALNESNRALFDQVNALKQMKVSAATIVNGADLSFSVLSKLVSKQTTELQNAKAKTDKDFDTKIKTQNDSLSGSSSLRSATSSAFESMKPAGESQTNVFRSANSQLTALMGRLGVGKLPNADDLKNVLSGVQAGPDTKDFSSKSAYLKEFYAAKNNLDRLQKVAGTQETVEQKMLDALNDQKKAYDDGVDAQVEELNLIVSNAQDQLDQLKGQSNTLISIDQALQAFLLKIAQASQNPDAAAPEAINNAYQTYLGRSADDGADNYWTKQVEGGMSVNDAVGGIANSSEAKIRQAYQDILGRQADAGGLAFYFDSMDNKGASIEEIRADLKKSAEYTSKPKLPSFDVGVDNLPKDTIAQLHEGEAVLPKADNRALRSAVAGNATNGTQVVAALKAVQAEMAGFRAENKAGMVAVQRDTSITANKIKRIEQGGLIIRDTSDA